MSQLAHEPPKKQGQNHVRSTPYSGRPVERRSIHAEHASFGPEGVRLIPTEDNIRAAVLTMC